MVQLSLITPSGAGLSEQLARLERQWPGGGPVTAAACAATAQHFHSWASRTLEEAEQRRVSAYFNAVMRRHLMRSRDSACAPARRRLVAASIEADLVQAGWRADVARREAHRVAGVEDTLGGVA